MTYSVFTEGDVCSAFDEMEQQYEPMLRQKFTDLFEISVTELEKKFEDPEDKKKFIKTLRRRYEIEENTDNIEDLLDKIRIKKKWGLERYQGLYCILEEHVDLETHQLRQYYKHLVTGWFEVRAFFDTYKRLVKEKYAYRLHVRYNVPPSIIERIKTLWGEIRERFVLPPLEVLLYDKRYSSLLLTWVIDADEETNAIVRTLLIQNLQVNIPFLEENDITHLIYNFEVIYPVSVGPVIHGIDNFPLLP